MQQKLIINRLYSVICRLSSHLYICREISTNQPFLCKTNPISNPILSAVGGLQMNVISLVTKAYENKSNWTLGENKPKTNPKQTQFKPNLVRRRRIAERVKLMQSVYLQRITEKKMISQSRKTKPIQTQTKPISASFFL